tara:strand:- start:38 stop:793 length:756 start_codon:yes stop_codon:yes gene_type:complete
MLGQRKAPKAAPKKAEIGFVLYQGPSALTGDPIAVIATMSTSNKKTGSMIQTWIIRADISPVEASAQKLDNAICGNCPHRQSTGGACYVNIGQAPGAVYRAYIANRYKAFDPSLHSAYFIGRSVRLGAYGDPAAAPFEAFETVLKLSNGHTGYTHQIGHKGFDSRFLTVCQVSADTPKQAIKYQALGAKTFRVALADDDLLPGEIECKADSEGLQCIDCGLCDGQAQNIAIAVHGSRSNRFKSNLIASVAA